MARITVAKVDSIIIPHVNVIRDTGDERSDTDRTAGGYERRDFVRAWREWEIRTAAIPATIADALKAHLEARQWGYVAWWCYTMGQESPVMARIPYSSFSSELVLGRLDRRLVSFNVIEQ